MNRAKRNRLVCLILGIMLIFFSYRGFRDAAASAEFMETAVETTAVVSDKYTYYDNDNRAQHEVYVTFNTDRGEVETLLVYAQRPNEIRIDDVLTVYYNPANPFEAQGADISGRMRTMGIVCAGLSVVFILIGIVLIRRR